MQNGFVQFTDESGKVVTTNGSLTVIRDGSRNLAFYGSRGRSVLSDKEFEDVLDSIGLPVPAAPVAADTDDDDDDTDFTLPA